MAKGELVLVKTLRDFSREELELQIAGKRLRRIALARVYHEGKASKLQHQNDQTARRFMKEIDLLNADLIAVDKAIDKAEQRLIKIGEYTEGYALVKDLIEEMEQSDG